MPKTDISATKVAAIAGISYQALDRWIKADIVTCDVPAEGTGSRRRFTARDLTFVLLARTLQDLGLPLSTIRSFVRIIADNWTEDDPDMAGCLIVSPNGVIFTGAYFSDISKAGAHLAALQQSTSQYGDGPETLPSVLLVIYVNRIAQRAWAEFAAL